MRILTAKQFPRECVQINAAVEIKLRGSGRPERYWCFSGVDGEEILPLLQDL
jgi:hypothetical protein